MKVTPEGAIPSFNEKLNNNNSKIQMESKAAMYLDYVFDEIIDQI